VNDFEGQLKKEFALTTPGQASFKKEFAVTAPVLATSTAL